jgi:hypothetical protein
MSDNEFLQPEERKTIIVTDKELPDFPMAAFDNADKTIRIPISELSAGTATIASLGKFLLNITSEEGGTGLYYTIVPKGAKMVAAKDGSGLIGASFQGNNLVGQARHIPVAADPVELGVAVALLAISQKMDKIEANTEEIMSYLVEKDERHLRADLEMLQDVYKNIRFNWDNTPYISAHMNKIVDIEQDARENVMKYKESIQKDTKKLTGLHTLFDVNNRMKKMQHDFQYYRLSLYLFAFSSFLQTVLNKNLQSDYLRSKAKEISDYEYDYRIIYSKCFDILDGFAKRSVDNQIAEGVAQAQKSIGHFIGNIPVIKDGPVDEALIDSGIKMHDAQKNSIEKVMNTFTRNSQSGISAFASNLQLTDKLVNGDTKIAWDKQNLYIETS